MYLFKKPTVKDNSLVFEYKKKKISLSHDVMQLAYDRYVSLKINGLDNFHATNFTNLTQKE